MLRLSGAVLEKIMQGERCRGKPALQIIEITELPIARRTSQHYQVVLFDGDSTAQCLCTSHVNQSIAQQVIRRFDVVRLER
jgi:hypothetical protein